MRSPSPSVRDSSTASGSQSVPWSNRPTPAARDRARPAFSGFGTAGSLVRPIQGAKLTDTFGAARSGGRNEGIDIFAPSTPITVAGAHRQGFTNGLGGNVVRIQGDDGRFYYYAHLTGGSKTIEGGPARRRRRR